MHSVILRFVDGTYEHLEVGDFKHGMEIADIELVEEPLLADPGKNKRLKEQAEAKAYSHRDIVSMNYEQLKTAARALGCDDVEMKGYLELRNFLISKQPQQSLSDTRAEIHVEGSLARSTIKALPENPLVQQTIRENRHLT